MATSPWNRPENREAQPPVEFSPLDPTALADFHDTLKNAKRIVAVIGAGLSASSGLGTFRGTNGLWKNQDITAVASPAGFVHDPGLVWQFYSYRRRDALAAFPNPAHRALALLAQRQPKFTMLTQNVDDLSRRAGHPPAQLKELHGNLFALRCVNAIKCGYTERENYTEVLMPRLDPAKQEEEEAMGGYKWEEKPRASPLLLAGIARKHAAMKGDDYVANEPTARDLDSLKAPDAPLAEAVARTRLHSGLGKEDLPKCPACGDLLRPDVVWFGEPLAQGVVEEVDGFFAEEEPVDLCLVIGTSSQVWPAAGYAETASKRGARIAVVNTRVEDAKGLVPGRDWVFVGDAAVVVPQLLEPIVGKIEVEGVKSWEEKGSRDLY